MAPIEDDAGALLVKCMEEKVPDVLNKYDELCQIEDPEETPYKTKYKARRLLQDAIKDVERLLEKTAPSREADRGRLMVGQLFFYLGKNFYFCEEVPQAEMLYNRGLERYLRSPLRLEPQYFAHLQDMFNSLGALWCGRGNYSQGMNYLRRAQIMFKQRPEAVRTTNDELVNNNYTLTKFQLGQAYGGLKKEGIAALYLAETMHYQLKLNAPGARSLEMRQKDPFDCKEWVRNCCSLSDFFANECMFWTAEYLLHCALVMCERCGEVVGFKPESIDELTAEVVRDMGNLYCTRLKFARTVSEYPQLCEHIWKGERKKQKQLTPEEEEEMKQGSKLEFRGPGGQAKAPEGGTGPILWDEVFPEVVFLEDEEDLDMKLAEEAEPAEAIEARAAGTVAVGSDKTGWLEVAPGEWVRLPVYFECLHEYAQRRIRRANTDFVSLRGDVYSAAAKAISELEAAQDEQAGAANASKEAVKKEEQGPVRLPSCAATAFEPVREIFKIANHYFLKALQYFLLDGWVTEHVKILQELSGMYRLLAHWEKDPKRLAAMLERRVRMLAPLLDLLNPRAYVAFYRQIAFESGETCQELHDVKTRGGLRQPEDALSDDEDEAPVSRGGLQKIARRNELAKKAVKYYSIFIDSYHTDGKVPESIDPDHVRAYLLARMHRARLRCKTKGLAIDEQMEGNKLALWEYEWILNYAARHPECEEKPEIGMIKELHFCREMAGMLPSKLNRLAARRSKR
eukprot:TRINITY_DN47445_c0_g1_i1.p1 TRINITY_DN47445_c0_g1~~TRINITY_DN47445_c0_g1_i1.p1  ORF type:complete len:739 (-),score=205.21 TRINITY_DN47445_c0_g1_i1:2-2218(-)